MIGWVTECRAKWLGTGPPVCLGLWGCCLGRLFELRAFRRFHNVNSRSATIWHIFADGTNEIPHDKGSPVLGRCRIREGQKSRTKRHQNRAFGPNPSKIRGAGEAMRHLNTNGEIAWKATPAMLSRLADAEQEARDDELAEWS
jgi:hypothetical protein